MAKDSIVQKDTGGTRSPTCRVDPHRHPCNSLQHAVSATTVGQMRIVSACAYNRTFYDASMVATPEYAEFLGEQLAPLGRITTRRMFGKTGVFCDGAMLGMVTENTLYFRVDEQNRAAFAEAQSDPPLNYRKKGSLIDLAFWRAPDRLFDNPDELVRWARAALGAAMRVAMKRKATSAGRTIRNGR